MSIGENFSAHQILVKRLSAICALPEADRAALESLPFRCRSVAKDTDVLREGDISSECCLLLDGFLARYRVLSQGQRQIFSFHVPGDIPDLQSLHIERMDHSLGTLTRCELAFIPHAAVRKLTDKHPNLAAAFWRDTLIDAAVFREWLAGIGRRTASQRIAHLFCEIYTRLCAVDLVEAWEFRVPITQTEIADALGLSTVHVNRVLQDLRARGLISSRGPSTKINDWEGLKRAGDFDDSYLHLRTAA